MADLRFGRWRKTKFFSLEVELAGMLAPEVQATTIDNRVPLAGRESQWIV